MALASATTAASSLKRNTGDADRAGRLLHEHIRRTRFELARHKELFLASEAAQAEAEAAATAAGKGGGNGKTKANGKAGGGKPVGKAAAR